MQQLKQRRRTVVDGLTDASLVYVGRTCCGGGYIVVWPYGPGSECGLWCMCMGGYEPAWYAAWCGGPYMDDEENTSGSDTESWP